MSCTSPVKAYLLEDRAQPVFYRPDPGKRFTEILLPCNGCIDCRTSKARDWAIRCMHELHYHDKSCFLTLTFNDENLFSRSNPWSLDKSELQNFIKRLRFRFSDRKILFLQCGEYGTKEGRPHYHCIIFGHDFDDKEFYKSSDATKYGAGDLYTSPTLSELWPFGFATIGSVTYESAAYVARYCMKKITGPAAENHYMRIDPETGEYFKLEPEFMTSSKRPALGKKFFDDYWRDMFPRDYVISRGKQQPCPTYYALKLLPRVCEKTYEIVREKRALHVENIDPHEQSPERLAVKAECQELRVKRLQRSL